MSDMTVRIAGIAPFIMHSQRLANALDPEVKELKALVAKKDKDKTDADRAQIQEMEWRLGLYLDEELRPCIPSRVVNACLVQGARKFKLGKQVESGGIFLAEASTPVIYRGPKDIDKLWDSGKYRLDTMVKRPPRTGALVLATRPVFNEWEADLNLHTDPTKLNEDQILNIVRKAGADIGMGDWRPQHGRFEVTSHAA